jgi:hypothetical protein
LCKHQNPPNGGLVGSHRNYSTHLAKKGSNPPKDSNCTRSALFFRVDFDRCQLLADFRGRVGHPGADIVVHGNVLRAPVGGSPAWEASSRSSSLIGRIAPGVQLNFSESADSSGGGWRGCDWGRRKGEPGRRRRQKVRASGKTAAIPKLTFAIPPPWRLVALS